MRVHLNKPYILLSPVPVREITGFTFLMIDIRDFPEALDAINDVLNSGRRADIGNERRQGKDNIVVVEITRVVKTKKPM